MHSNGSHPQKKEHEAPITVPLVSLQPMLLHWWLMGQPRIKLPVPQTSKRSCAAGKAGQKSNEQPWCVQDERMEQEQQPLDWKGSHPHTSNAHILWHRLQHHKPYPQPSLALVGWGLIPTDFGVHLRGYTYFLENNSQISIILILHTH